MTVNRKPDENEEIGVVNNERSGEESASPEVGRIHNERPGEVAADPEFQQRIFLIDLTDPLSES
jgi:hypothetical protein